MLDSAAADLDSNADCKAKLYSGGYHEPNAIQQAESADQIKRACGLLPGDANLIWKSNLVHHFVILTVHVVQSVSFSTCVRHVLLCRRTCTTPLLACCLHLLAFDYAS